VIHVALTAEEMSELIAIVECAQEAASAGDFERARELHQLRVKLCAAYIEGTL
jgi:hypothetical protein